MGFQLADAVEAIALAYEAGAEPARWPRFLAKIAGTLADGTTALQIEDVRRSEASFAFSVQGDPAWLQAYVRHYAPLNPWTNGGAAQMQPGSVLVGESVISLARLKKTEFYNDVLRPQGISHSIAAVIARDDDRTAFLSLCRSSRRGPWSSRESRYLETLLPHLRRAVDLHRRIGSHRLEHEALAETAERMSWAIMFIDRSGRVLFENRAARRFERELRTRILGVASRGGGAVIRTTGSPLIVSVASLEGWDPLLHARPMLCVFAIDPDAPRASAARLLRETFGLTRAETRLALALGEGLSLANVAARTNVTLWTVRSHLKKIFEKTNMRRQADVVRLVVLLSGVGSLDASE